MVVASSPPSEVSIEPELGLIKAALLYGDEVTLLGAVTTMFLGVEEWGRFSVLEQLRLVRKVAPYMTDHNFDEVVNGADTIESILTGGGRSNRLLQAQLAAKFRPTQESVARGLDDIADKAGVTQLANARASGLLKIESVDPGTAADLIASCVISARLAEEGKSSDKTHTDQMVNTFLDRLSDYLSVGREYLIFDERIADLTRSAIEAGVFKPASGPPGRSAQAMTASGLMARLPTFPEATVDEILDIRAELAPVLARFRAAMVGLSKDFKQPSWETGFEDQVHDAWVGSVHPAIEEIGESVQANKSLLTLASDLTGGVKGALPGLAILGAGTAGHDNRQQVVGAALTATGIVGGRPRANGYGTADSDAALLLHVCLESSTSMTSPSP
jgi:hypothetical protein